MSENSVMKSNQFVIFKLDKEEYGIDIRKVTTIERMSTITRVPKTANYVKGVISLRGEVIPVICLRKRFNLPELKETDDSRIIVFKVKDIVLGMTVDMVTEVISISSDNIEGINNINNDIANYISGVGKIKDRIITLLNLQSLVNNS